MFHAVESRHGVGSIRRLLAAYGDGLDTDQALARVFKKTVADFDREIWEWCVTKGPETWPSEIVHYDSLETPVLLPNGNEAEEESGGVGE